MRSGNNRLPWKARLWSATACPKADGHRRFDPPHYRLGHTLRGQYMVHVTRLNELMYWVHIGGFVRWVRRALHLDEC